MPLYEFRCPDGDVFEQSHPMDRRPDEASCPTCGQSSRRRMPSPRLSIAGGSAYGLIDATRRSAHEPEVVSTLPTAPRRRGAGYTTNPLHQKLPRS
ncbi:zinc ribbon domain-containing protein [Arthrobacter rhombi]|uniref:FmdB family zinc ribbon protein n=1 Tax=Arthrobacter rhombi TaxID=71253 RepID=UPI0031D5C065